MNSLILYMKWRTSVSTIREGKTIVRGEDAIARAREFDFASNIYFLLTGVHPTQQISRVINALLSVAIDHGVGNASTLSARLSASTGASIPQSLIAGIAGFSSLHGGATGDAAQWYIECIDGHVSAQDAVDAKLRAKVKIPGFGHKEVDKDDRADFLLQSAKDNDCFGTFCAFAQDVEATLHALKSKPIPLNIDGAIAAVALDCNMSWQSAMALFLIARVPGLLAHILEEQSQDNGLRRLEESEVDFI